MDARGLTAAEAGERLRRVGPNALPVPSSRPAWRQLMAQFVHFFAALLWVAGVLAIVGGMPELGIAIFAVVLLNGVFAFFQEYRAERAAERLHDLVPRRVTVIRDGQPTEIDAVGLVPGDVVVLSAGDRISADLFVLEGHGLLADESILTGESVPIDVEAGGALHAGTFLVQGEGFAEVVTTGGSTGLGRVAELTRTVARPPTPLARELHRLVRTIAFIALTVGVVFFGLMLLLGTDATEGFVFAVGVTVALVPEGLLPTVTLALAMGAQRMADRNALVRRLESVETLGSTTFICTDKTGTLTENRMNVVSVWTPLGDVTIEGHGYTPEATISGPPEAVEAARRLAIVARRCSMGRAIQDGEDWISQGDPMEAAIDALASRLAADVAGSLAAEPDLVRLAFDPRRRRASVVTGQHVLVKGAPDSVVTCCVGVPDDVAKASEALSRRGLRVLAVASRQIQDPPPRRIADAERDLTLLGLLGIVDPPRTNARRSVEACRAAGIKVAMITGDHPATATAIADATGLRFPSSLVVTGEELPDDEALLGALVDRDGIVLARVTPEDKLRIARALQRRGHVVAMTGDGVNDGPALQEADIGIAMGKGGTDVAREAADLVLLDDEFDTIVEAVRLGRATFINARQFLTYHLTDNVAELTPFVIWAISGDRFPLALGVLQILALDLGTDTLTAAALGAEHPATDVLHQPPISGRLLDGRVAFRAFGVLGPIEAAMSMIAFLLALTSFGWRPGDAFPTGHQLAVASGATFLTVVLGQTANAFGCRSSNRPVWLVRFGSNRYLFAGLAFGLTFSLMTLLIPPVARFFDQARPPLIGWIVALVTIPVMLLADGWVKHHARRRSVRRPPPRHR